MGVLPEIELLSLSSGSLFIITGTGIPLEVEVNDIQRCGRLVSLQQFFHLLNLMMVQVGDGDLGRAISAEKECWC